MQKIAHADNRLERTLNGLWLGYVLLWRESGNPERHIEFQKSTDYGLDRAYGLKVHYFVMQDSDPENALHIPVGTVAHAGKDDVGLWLLVQPYEMDEIAKNFPNHRLFDGFLTRLTNNPPLLDLTAMCDSATSHWQQANDERGTRSEVYDTWKIAGLYLVDGDEA